MIHIFSSRLLKQAAETDISRWTPVGGQRGSNEGGTYKDPQGQMWYVKFPRDEDHCRSEFCAGKLYELAGVQMPHMQLVEMDGRLGVASQWIKGLRVDPDGLPKAPGAREGFGVDAWLGNRDSVGLVYDNMLVDEMGRAQRIDPGGALDYRAQGGPKPGFGDEVGELDTLRDPKWNQEAHSVFGDMTPGEVKKAIELVTSIPDASVEKVVMEYGPSNKAQLARKLLARKHYMERYKEKIEGRAA